MKRNAERVLREARRLAVPTAAETRRALAAAHELVARVADEARQRGLPVEPVLVGSLAKGTHLRTPLDIDVFVLFPPSTPRDDLERLGILLGQAVLDRPVLRYAEHPYVHGAIRGYTADLVPAYKLDTPQGRLSAVDRTPFHTAYVRARATDRHRQEIRLLKLFLRGTRCYGAETATGGLSGYLAELLVLHHGSFLRVLEPARRWTPPVRIASGGGATDPGSAPLFVADPVDPDRNAAAAVRTDTLARFRRAADAFLAKPRIQFFRPEPSPAWTVRRLADRLRRRPTVAVEAPSPPGRAEARLPQARRMLSKGQRVLEREGFHVSRAEAHLLDGDRRVLLLWGHDPPRLSPTREHVGPPERAGEHAHRFRQKWAGDPRVVGGPEVHDGRWRVTVRRGHRSPAAVLGPHLARLLDGFDYGSEDRRRARVLTGVALVRAQRRRGALTAFLAGRDPWDW